MSTARERLQAIADAYSDAARLTVPAADLRALRAAPTSPSAAPVAAKGKPRLTEWRRCPVWHDGWSRASEGNQTAVRVCGDLSWRVESPDGHKALATGGLRRESSEEAAKLAADTAAREWYEIPDEAPHPTASAPDALAEARKYQALVEPVRRIVEEWDRLRANFALPAHIFTEDCQRTIDVLASLVSPIAPGAKEQGR